jgi:hypothetical protein
MKTPTKLDPNDKETLVAAIQLGVKVGALAQWQRRGYVPNAWAHAINALLEKRRKGVRKVMPRHEG